MYAVMSTHVSNTAARDGLSSRTATWGEEKMREREREREKKMTKTEGNKKKTKPEEEKKEKEIEMGQGKELVSLLEDCPSVKHAGFDRR